MTFTVPALWSILTPLRWNETRWTGRPWHEAVLYELHVGIFDGFRGVISELSRLAALGVTAIELMPIAEFPGARNWGYDGVLPFAPEASYGTPEDLKALVDAAHAHGLMIFLDVVYNHFGPDGNYVSLYAPQLFRDDAATPWGPAIDFRREEVRRFFTETHCMAFGISLRRATFRCNSCHKDPDWLSEMATEVRKKLEPDRHVHLVLENDDNTSEYLARDFDAQWNDDGHHVLHVLLTGECGGYYEDYKTDPAEKLARCLEGGFIYQVKRPPTAEAVHAERRLKSSRRRRLFCFCKTMTKSETAPSASGLQFSLGRKL